MQVVPDSEWFAGLSNRSGNAPHDLVTPAKLRSGLRELYRDLLDEPFPERLAVLICQMERQERANEKGEA